MPRTFTDLERHALNGPTMGTRWSALFHMPRDFDAAPVAAALAAAVAEVDRQMSTWKPDSDLMRLNSAPPGAWVSIPIALLDVLGSGLDVGRASGGAFDIGMGDAVSAWGFGPLPADAARIREALSARRHPAHEVLELDRAAMRARKHAPLELDLSGIAKGYGVDRLAEVARGFGVESALMSIDGEVRVLGVQPDGRPWAIAVERPDCVERAAMSILELQDNAVATSGDYRHWIEFDGRRFSHTMDPRRGGPLAAAPASVTVLAETCMLADAWATAFMVMGSLEGARTARRIGLNALFVDRDQGELRRTRAGGLFETGPDSGTP